MEIKKINEHLYDYSAGIYSGVFVPEKVMKKLVKLNTKYKEELRKLLKANEDIIYPSHWTMAHTEDDNGEITHSKTIEYVEEDYSPEEIIDRITLFRADKPKYIKDVYLVKDRDEAKKIAEYLLKEEME